MKKIFLSCLLIGLLPIGLLAQSNHVLWYSKPATYFEESLVLGNGKMGASVFGGLNRDQIYLNDATLWSGEPVPDHINPEAHTFLPSVREALKGDHYALADSLNHKLQGRFSQSYAPLGTLFLDFNHQDEAKNYRRELDLETAISTVRYEIQGIKYKREYFISYPDQVMVIRISSSKKGALDFGIRLSSLLSREISTNLNILTLRGHAPVKAEPSYRGNLKDAVVFDPTKGTRFTSMVKIKTFDGHIEQKDSSLEVHEATEATLYISIATSFKGYNQNPVKQASPDLQAFQNLIKAYGKPFPRMEQAHILNYKKYYTSFHLDLGPSTAPDLPTNERLIRYSLGNEDKNLEVLYCQFGRYLLISSSRTPFVPANLQGIWNPYIRPPWSSNYTLNINLEENYWLAESTHLSAMHLPLLGFIKNLSKTGAITARDFYNARGWCAGHNSDIWAMSNPVGDFGQGSPVWANWNMGGTWLSTHLWEHYAFTQDREFLRKEAYPIMKGAAEFCLDWLVEDKDHFLISSPSTSPENEYISQDGYKGATFYGGTADLAMIRELLTDTYKACEILGKDTRFKDILKNTLSRLLPYHVGKKGNLQEWYFDWEDADPKHRHQSHLFGLFPGHQITPEENPVLANACRKTLEIKGDETTGWSKGWRINLWARLEDGNHAYKMYRELLKYVEPDGVRTSYQNGGGTYPNLFDAHPPFQIDGNFGGSAAVVEMLVQSTDKEIHLLPALPDAWDRGSVKGICARGGYTLSLEWDHHRLKNCSLMSFQSGNCRLVYSGKVKTVKLVGGQRKVLNWD